MFYVLEGIDGSGTTAVSHQVTAKLNELGANALWTCEPTTEGPVGKIIRDALKGRQPVPREAMLGLFVADRRWHVENVIRPTLAQNRSVVCDRYAYSTWVYQQDEYPVEVLRMMMEGIYAPTRVFILDVEVSIAQKRKTPDKEMFDAFEAQERYRKRYLDLLSYNFRLGAEHVAKVDASKPIETVVNTVISEILTGNRSG